MDTITFTGGTRHVRMQLAATNRQIEIPELPYRVVKKTYIW